MFEQCFNIPAEFALLMIMSFFGAGYIYMINEQIDRYNQLYTMFENNWSVVKLLRYRMDAVSDELYQMKALLRQSGQTVTGSITRRLAKLEKHHATFINACQLIVDDTEDDFIDEIIDDHDNNDATDTPTPTTNT